MYFTISNDEGSVCHVTVWKEEIDRVQPNLQLNSVVCIEGAEVAAIKPRFNQGNLNFQLIIRKNTTFTILKDQRKINIENDDNKISLITFADVKSYTGRIRIRGFVKCAFRLLKYKLQESFINYGGGSITDGNMKLIVRIQKFPEVAQLWEKG